MGAVSEAGLAVTTPSDREVVVTRDFNAPRNFVWDCHTKPALLKRWLLGPSGWTMPECDVDLRVGGAYRYLWRHPDGRAFSMAGVYQDIVAPERLVVLEHFNGEDALNVSVFTEHDGKTHLTHSMLFSSREVRDAAIKTGMTDGMEASYARIDQIAAESIM